SIWNVKNSFSKTVPKTSYPNRPYNLYLGSKLFSSSFHGSSKGFRSHQRHLIRKITFIPGISLFGISSVCFLFVSCARHCGCVCLCSLRSLFDGLSTISFPFLQ
ncbi:unnamed protein product, partial [Coffea canephora]